ncbi:MAG: spore germination protein [Clostridia bacterium]|nr:spore germination protein [Clostridia bacterium]
MVLEKKCKKMKKDFGESADLTIRRAEIGGRRAFYAAIEGLVDKELLEEHVIKPLSAIETFSRGSVEKGVYLTAPVEWASTLAEAEEEIASGTVALVIEGEEKICLLSVKKWERRSVEEPPTSSVIKGPREGFTEDVTVNAALLRRRLKSKSLVITEKKVGKYTGSKVLICYLSDVASPETVDLVTERLAEIDLDGVIDSSYLTKFLEDDPASLFPQVGSYEKPDVVAAKLLEGRVAILSDGSPIALTVPHLLIESFQDSQDYFKRNTRVTVTRFLRLFGAIIALFLPAAFVAVQEYQYQVLPLKFLITIINSTNGTPLSPTLEMLLVLIIFDILNEASVRMPRYVGMALSIVGAIVLGETAVSAGLLSSPAVLVTALSSIGLYLVPDDVGTYSLLRLLFVATAALLGLLGILFAVMLLLSHLVTLESFGSDYLSPYAPLSAGDLKDGFVKRELPDMVKRPQGVSNRNPTRIRNRKPLATRLGEEENGDEN